MKLCTVRHLPPDQRAHALELARTLNPLNAVRLMGPASAAMKSVKKWPNGQRITVGFLNGSPTQRKRVKPYFDAWSKYANVDFSFVSNLGNSYARVAFGPDEGSWSYVGTDAMMASPKEATINFGWLEDETDEDEYRRVCLHEVGHLLGLEHEDQQPASATGLNLNIPVILHYYEGPPNNWDEADVYEQVINKIKPKGVEYTPFDRFSIMAYDIPAEFTLDGKGVPLNDQLSPLDKHFISAMYPGRTWPDEIPLVIPGGAIVNGTIDDWRPVAEFRFDVGVAATYRVWTSYVGGPIQILLPADPNNPLVSAKQQFTSKIPPGSYRIRLTQLKTGQAVDFRVNSRKLS